MTRRRILIVIVILLIPMAAHAVWDQVESTLLAREISRLAQRGEPVDIVAPRASHDKPEPRRAAGLYAAAASLARWQTRGDNYNMTAKDVELPATDPRLEPARLQAYLSEAEPALYLAGLAAQFDFAGFGSLEPELQTNQSSLQTLSGMINLKADLLSVRGETDLAAEELVHSIVLQRTIPIPYYRYISVGRLYGSLRVFLKYTSPDDNALRRLQAALESWPDDDGVAAHLQRERARRLGMFWPYPPGGASWALRPQQGYRARPAETLAFLAFRPVLTRALRREFQPYADAISVARESWPAKLESARALNQRYGVDPARGPAAPSQTMLYRTLGVTDFRGVKDLTLTLPVGGMNLAFRRTAIATIAAERFRRAHAGQPPPSLDALVPEFLAAVPLDPFDGKPLKYRVAPDSYVVYSVDINRADDNGALHGFGTGIGGRSRPIRDDQSPRDIGIRVPLRVQ
jgi:hypothetical protein